MSYLTSPEVFRTCWNNYVPYPSRIFKWFHSDWFGKLSCKRIFIVGVTTSDITSLEYLLIFFQAELIHLRAELVESRAKRDILEQEFHSLLLQLHSSQLSHLPAQLSNRKQDGKLQPDVNNIRKKLEDEIRKSGPNNINKNNSESEELKFGSTLLELSQLRNENVQLQLENASLRNSILALNSEVYGAKLAAKYLDKELAGRIQQLQLLGEEWLNVLDHSMFVFVQGVLLIMACIMRGTCRYRVINYYWKCVFF